MPKPKTGLPQGSDGTFSVPLARPLPQKQHVFYVWSPKLKRQLRLFTRLELEAWVMLEADPIVKTFCEYPCSFFLNGRTNYVSFWVPLAETSKFWFVVPSHESAGLRASLQNAADLNSWVSRRNIGIRVLDETDTREHPVGLDNWIQIIHHLAANGQYVTESLLEGVLTAAKSGSLSVNEIVNQQQGFDREICLAAIFQLIQDAKLQCEDLASSPLSHTLKVAAT